jgi:PTS system cellobiose-specific IIB component
MQEFDGRTLQTQGGVPMRVLVICGAGASSTFLAHRMRAAAAARGLAPEIRSGAIDSLESQLPANDVVLVGSHLGERFADILALASLHGRRAVLLPALAFDAAGANAALDLVEAATVHPLDPPRSLPHA